MKKAFALFLLGLFLISFASAFEFDNVLKYDEDTKEAHIYNCDFWIVTCLNRGDEIGKAKLNTPLNVRVPRGYQKVAEFDLWAYEDYSQALKQFTFKDMRRGKQQINRNYDLKMLEYEDVEVIDYSSECSVLKNGTQVCNQIQKGSHTEQKEKWTKISPADLKKNEVITVGVFTEVQIGDYIDWIPQIYGVKVPQWATWREELDVDLQAWWYFDEETGGVTPDAFASYNGTVTGATLTTGDGGIIDEAYIFDGTADKIDVGTTIGNFGTGDFTITLWAKVDTLGIDNGNILSKHVDNNNLFYFGYNIGNALTFYSKADASSPARDTARHNTSTISDTGWHHIAVTAERGVTTKLYFDGSEVGGYAFQTTTTWDLNNSANTYFGRYDGTTTDFDGTIDEPGIYSRALNSTEISDLYNGGAAIRYKPARVGTALITPPHNSNFTTTLTDFNFTSTPLLTNLTNATLYLWNETDDTLLLTNFTTLSGDSATITTFANNLTQGIYKWNAETCGEDVGCENAISNNSFIIHDTSPTATIIAPSGSLDYFLIGENETLIYNFSETGQNLTEHLEECWYNYGEIENLMYTDGKYITGTGAANQIELGHILVRDNLTEKYIISAPSVTAVTNIVRVYEGLSASGQHQQIEPAGFDEEEVNISVSNGLHLVVFEGAIFAGKKAKLDKFTIDNTTLIKPKVDLNCTGNQTSFTYVNGVNNISIFARDAFGLIASNSSTWEYVLTEISQTFDNETTEGSIQDISALIKLEEGQTISAAVLNYNGTLSAGTSEESGENTLILKSNFLTPNVETTEIDTFQWSIVLSGGTIINLSEQNQTVFNVAADNCSSFTNRIMGLEIVDEETQIKIPSGTELEVALNIFSSDRSTQIVNFSNEFDNVNPIEICLNLNISGNISYSLDTIVRYKATGYANEYYNIVDYTLDNNSVTQNLTLYDLNISDSTDFQLTFTGEDYLPVENALVLVERQYISEDVFKTVELPKTDANGQTILHLVRNDVIYNIVVMKDNQILGNFENIIAFCADLTIGDCTLPLNAISNISQVFEYDDVVGLIFDEAPKYNETTRVTSFSFASTDGTTKVVNMVIERRDIFGNRSVCENTVVSSSGTVSCQVSQDITDTSLVSTISVDGETILTDTVIIDSTAYGGDGYAMLFIFAIGTLLMFSGSKTWTLVGVVLNYVFGVSLGLMVGGILGVGATGIFIIVISMVGIWQLNKGRKQ